MLKNKKVNKIQIYDPETYKLITTFQNIDEAKNSNYVKSKSRALILLAISTNIVYENYRWMRLNADLPDETIQELPIENIYTVQKKLKQVKPDTQEIIKTYNDIDEVIKEFRISRKSLRNAIANNTICKGYLWILQ